MSFFINGQEAQADRQQGKALMDRNSFTAILGTSVSFGLSEIHLIFASLSAILTCVFVAMQIRNERRRNKKK